LRRYSVGQELDAAFDDEVGRCRLTASKSVLKAKRLWFQRLKLQYDETLSNFAFNFNSRRYNEEDDTEDLLRAQLMVDPMTLAGGFRV